MNIVTTGDLAQNFSLSRQNAALRKEFDRLTLELNSGQVKDVTDRLDGRFSALAGFERELTLLKTYTDTVSQAQTQATVMQTALETVQTQFAGLSETLALSFTAAGLNDQQNVSAEAKSALNSVLSALNTTVAGRALFSGNEVGTPPLQNTEAILAGVRGAVSGLTSATDIFAAADVYFGPGGGFETTLYRGATQDLASFDLGAGESATFALRADNLAIRDVLKTIALSALATDSAVSLPDSEMQVYLQSLTEMTIGVTEGITDLRSNLGFVEGRIETASVRISSETSSVELIHARLIEVDEFKTAADLKTVETRLETLYTVTARSSRLSLVNFL